MRSYLPGFAFLLALLAPGGAQAVQPACRVIDGDSLVCSGERMRLKGICAAEMREPGGREAKAALETWLEQPGDLQVEHFGQDRYARSLVVLSIKGAPLTQDHIGPPAGRGLKYCR